MALTAMMPHHDHDRRFEEPPSLSASMADNFEFDPDRERSPFFGIPSTHSGFRSELESDAGSESAGPWSPPAWRKAGSGWYRHHLAADDNPSRSRDVSPQYESAGEGDLTIPANIPLPASPLKNTPRTSPERDPGPVLDPQKHMIEHPASAEPPSHVGSPSPDVVPNNYIRFAVRAEVQHRTEPVEAALVWCRQKIDALTHSKTSVAFSIFVAFLAVSFFRVLFEQPEPGPVPDLVKVASLAKSYEPLIYYSENGAQQIGDLQETGVAVWDLGESVRTTNMTSGPIIVQELDELSESLKGLASQLTKFFANVDGDVDSILIVMEWAKRELAQVSNKPNSAFDNLHSMLARVGILETASGQPTALGKIITDLFGQTTPQRTKTTLQRTFNEFLSILEESINNELTHCTAIFGLFEAIEQQFLNLQRTVIRETDKQEREEGEMLSSLWTRVIGANASQLRKYEKNKHLLLSVREKTVRNKHLVVDYNGKLLQLKANLEILRKKLISPLVRSNASSTLSVEEQILGLDGTYEYLRRVREKQKQKMLELLYGAGNRRVTIGRDDIGEIEGV